MLRDPESYYQKERSKTLLKVKVFLDDEATVIGYSDGKGLRLGIGALIVENDKGV